MNDFISRLFCIFYRNKITRFLFICLVFSSIQLILLPNTAVAQFPCAGTIVNGCCCAATISNGTCELSTPCTIDSGNITICHDDNTIGPNVNSIAGNTPGKHFQSCDWVEDGSGTPLDGGTGADGLCDITVGDTGSGMGHDNDALGACEVAPPGECETAENCDDANECTTDTCESNMCVNTPVMDGIACETFDECSEGSCQSGLCEAELIFPPPQGCPEPPIGGDPNGQIPTLSEWGLIFLMAFLFMAAIWRMKRHQSV